MGIFLEVGLNMLAPSLWYPLRDFSEGNNSWPSQPKKYYQKSLLSMKAKFIRLIPVREHGTLTVLTVAKKGKSERVLIGFRTWNGRKLVGIGQSL